MLKLAKLHFDGFIYKKKQLMKIELEKILVYYLLKCQDGRGELSLLFNKGSKGYFSLYPFIYYNNFLSFFAYFIRSLII